ncbi:hypothetical protein B0H14DRAFT_2984861 [Mycena olivaceomarginata]|nr:hypothetical protein B0H14DRAFT_2984861 [Mycena olivaceomarginata]
MTGECIPANPDISGIGVRAAIYAQNLLCFAPVVAHLWDGNVSADEMRGVKDQSIGMLAIAFAILISTIIGAANVRSGQIVTSFHAAVILDLSWMNNTSTWICRTRKRRAIAMEKGNPYLRSGQPGSIFFSPLFVSLKRVLLAELGLLSFNVPGTSSPKNPFLPSAPSTCR